MEYIFCFSQRASWFTSVHHLSWITSNLNIRKNSERPVFMQTPILLRRRSCRMSTALQTLESAKLLECNAFPSVICCTLCVCARRFLLIHHRSLCAPLSVLQTAIHFVVFLYKQMPKATAVDKSKPFL